jgi:hypothetical protein
MSFEEKYNGWHKRISLIKSYIRIITCGFATGITMGGSLTVAIIMLAVGLAIAEFLGIIEENV